MSSRSNVIYCSKPGTATGRKQLRIQASQRHKPEEVDTLVGDSKPGIGSSGGSWMTTWTYLEGNGPANDSSTVAPFSRREAAHLSSSFKNKSFTWRARWAGGWAGKKEWGFQGVNASAARCLPSMRGLAFSLTSSNKSGTRSLLGTLTRKALPITSQVWVTRRQRT